MEDEYRAFSGPRINYSMRTLDGIQIKPHNILFNRTYLHYHPEHIIEEGKHRLFPCRECDMSFDPFAAVFYMLSRYEEYEDYDGDQFGRFKASDSLAYLKGFLEVPVVDQWILELGEKICSRYPELSLKQREYRYLSTIDVDHAYAYKHRSFVRIIGGVLSDIIRLRFENLLRRLSVLIAGKSDPYDSFATLQKLHEEYGVEACYFFLLAKYGKNDKNISPENKSFQKLLKNIAEKNKVGIHPGFNSNSKTELLDHELRNFKMIFGSDAKLSRQHYLIFRLPDTFNLLVEKGIEEDFSMGFADHIGFRAGTSVAFPFYDLKSECRTKLICNPFMAMDVTMTRYMGLSKSEAIQRLEALRDEVKKVNGVFMTLWHNESLSEIWQWKGWSDLYEEVIKIGKQV